MSEKKSKPIQKSVYFDEKSLTLLDLVASRLSVSRSALIRILINRYCKENKKSFTDIEKQVDLITNKGGL